MNCSLSRPACVSAALEWVNCSVEGNGKNDLPPKKPFPNPPPTASFDAPTKVQVGEPAEFVSASRAAKGKITAVLWDFGDGIPVVKPRASHTYHKPGEYRVTLVVWDEAGRRAREEKRIRVVK